MRILLSGRYHFLQRSPTHRLGGLMAALILKAASSLLSGDAHPAVVACDNMGVVIHDNDCHRSLREAQSQADLIRCFQGNLAELPFEIIYKHVYGHQDKNLPWSALNLLQQLNTILISLQRMHSGVILPLAGLFHPTSHSRAFVSSSMATKSHPRFERPCISNGVMRQPKTSWHRGTLFLRQTLT